MCRALSLLASSMKGLFSDSVRCFHSVPSRLLISELCILGFSRAIFLLWALDHTMKAFMGRLTCTSPVAVWRVVGRLISGGSTACRSHHAATRRKATSSIASDAIAPFIKSPSQNKSCLISCRVVLVSNLAVLHY